MNGDDVVPFVGRHVEDHVGTAETRVVHDDVELTPGAQRLVDERVAATWCCDVVAVGDGLAAGLRDLPDDFVGRGLVGRAAIGRDAEIVDDDAGAVRRQPHGFGAPDAAS